ncbi:hypothetical protein FC697_16105 [Bacillus wiedmannii]|uniref:hypothetical protein n=1 Tax=Bacillus wiedmannii TaxID=1890302 RepID=UPI0010BD82B6|nr:hypothetical protein [Bacillus wiedmannii]TKH21237.1 hypothetical protein FC697_16105 [Bacillus wiedmannii]
MKSKKEFLKVLSTSFLLTAIVINASQFTTVAPGTGGHWETDKVTEQDKEKDIDRKKDEENIVIVKTEVKEKAVATTYRTLYRTLYPR